MTESSKRRRTVLHIFQHWLVGIRRTAGPEEFDAVASGYRLEIERMQAEVLEYLLRPLSERDTQSPRIDRAPGLQAWCQS